MSLVKSNPNKLFPSFFTDLLNTDPFFSVDLFKQSAFTPSVNIFETKEAFNIEVAAPGLKKDDFRVELEEDVLTISAEKKEEKSEEKESYTRKEFSFNSFTRSFRLPDNVRAAEMAGKYDNGILYLILPKNGETKGKSKKSIKVD